MFENFREFDVATSETTIHGRIGGEGPPLLLLHGIPETHVMWRKVAAALAQRFTVVAADCAASAAVVIRPASRMRPTRRCAPSPVISWRP